MSRRVNYEIPGIGHGSTPIPLAARVGDQFRTSGIMGMDPATREIPADGVRQVELAFGNAATLLDVAGIGREDIVFVEVLLADRGLRAEVDKHWLDWFPDEGDRPARHTTVRDLPSGMKAQLLLHAVAGEAHHG
jgi:2-iminobutanoate/2-iminopropanoate deaminase